MSNERNIIQKSKPFRDNSTKPIHVKNVYYGEVVSIDDSTQGGRIKVKILDLDNKITNTEDLPYCYPLIPKFFHVYPIVGEVVRVVIEDINYPERGRFWVGSIISQPQKIGFDTIYTALSTTDKGFTIPDAAPSTYPNATGVYPLLNEIALVGRKNTDIILRDNQVELRAGKHFDGELFTLNNQNPASISLTYEPISGGTDFYSNTLVMSDKIALISHSGVPKFKAAQLDSKERDRIFNEAHPIARGDVLVEALKILRNAIVTHIHGYASLPPDKDNIITALENIDFEKILQKNIVTN